MKMKQEHYDTLLATFKTTLEAELTRLSVDPAQPQTLKDLVKFHVEAYEKQGLTDRRMAFDLFWWVNKRASLEVTMGEFYKYAHDDHLYTALKAIVKELQA